MRWVAIETVFNKTFLIALITHNLKEEIVSNEYEFKPDVSCCSRICYWGGEHIMESGDVSADISAIV